VIFVSRATCFLALSVSCSSLAVAATQDIVTCDGYPCVNFSFGANVSRNGDLFGHTFVNPPRLGAGLEPLGGGQLLLGVAGSDIKNLGDFEKTNVNRHWPFAEVTATDPELPGLAVEVSALVPNGLDDSFVGTLPVAMATIRVTNKSDRPVQSVIQFDSGSFLGKAVRPLEAEGIIGSADGNKFVGWSAIGTERQKAPANELETQLHIEPGATGERRLMIGCWGAEYPCSARLTTPDALGAHIARHWEQLVSGTRRLEIHLPRSGDAEIDEFLRWYMTAGVAMTRALKDGTALTLGYHELNQRDSYWTTWQHLVLWPTLERRMIEESMWGQRADGKIPTTILPVIEREEDVDINCYFILRALRYVRYRDDQEFGLKMLPALKAAAEWLARRDTQNNGLPRQSSYWHDWKDVPGMKGRSYSPYASMLYVAAMRRLGEFCRQTGDHAAGRYLDLASRAEATLNRSTNSGGLFNDRYYEHLWDDPPDDVERVSQDQVVGVVFDVIPDAARDSVLDALQGSMTAWGARETFPYFSEEFGYAPGDYHNGGIWPFLNHVHAWALLKAGRQDEAFEILRKVGRADLILAGDYIPHEFIHGATGKQSGVPMQGWNAAIFGAIHFGLHGDGTVP